MKLPKVNLNKCRRSLNKVVGKVRKHLPTILTWTGTACAIASPICSGIATVKAKKALDAQPDDSTFFDDMKVAVPKYIPTAIATAGTIACGHGANHINLSRIGMLTTAAAGAIGYLNDVKNEVKERFGEEGYNETMAAVAQKRTKAMEESPLTPEPDEILLYEPITDQFIWTTPEQFIRAREHVNRMLNIIGECTLKAFIDILGGDTESTEKEKQAKYLRWCLSNEAQLRAIAEQNAGGIWVDIHYGLFQYKEDMYYRVDYDILPGPMWASDRENIELLGGLNG